MSRTFRIPGTLDLLIVDEPGTILAMSRDQRLDRDFTSKGPLFNRIAARRIRRVLALDGEPFPAVAPHGPDRPSPAQNALEERLDKLQPPCPGAQLQTLADYVLGQSEERPLGPLVQEVLGRLFVPDYAANAESFEDARLLDAAARSNNPLRQALWRMTGRIELARQRLAERAENDLAALHTTAIAVHNLVRAFERMRALAQHPGALRRIPSAEAASRCLAAPNSIVRQATAAGSMEEGSFRPGTLVLFRLERARDRSLRHDVAFMTTSWSRCPAHAWVPRLLSAVWESAALDQERERQAS